MKAASRRNAVRICVRAFASLVVLGALLAGHRVPITQQQALLNELREVAAIILALVGVWMALLYPKAFAQAFKMGEQSDPGFKRLVWPFRATAAIVAFIVLYGFVRSTLGAFLDVLWPFHVWFRTASFTLLSILILCQLWALVLAVAPVDELGAELEDAETSRNQLEQLRRLRQRG